LIDLAALTEAVYQRLKSDAAGAALRAWLPAGASAILLAEDVRNEALTVLDLPARPLLALRRGATPQLDRVVTMPIYTWYGYDDPSVGYGRLEQLPYLLYHAYESPLVVGTVAVGSIEIAAGPQTRDTRLGLLQMITVTIGAV
jgi:hypothetical protein